MLGQIVGALLRLFWMITPFFVLAMFLNMTEGMRRENRNRIAIKCAVSILTLSVVFYFLGRPLFEMLGITLDGFRIGAGITLLLTALGSVSGNPVTKKSVADPESERDISIVPLAIPFAIGPGMMGMIMISSIEDPSARGAFIFLTAMSLLTLIMGGMLIFAVYLRQVLGDNMIQVLGRLSGLFLAALAGQMIVEGMRNIWGTVKL